MDINVRTADRVVLAFGSGLGSLPGAAIEEIDAATTAKLMALLPQSVGDGGVSISADHTTLTLLPPSSAWLAAQQAAQAAQIIRQQHVTALASMRPGITSSATTTANDLAALQTIATALQQGVQPTQAQVLIILRLILRVLAVTNA